MVTRTCNRCCEAKAPGEYYKRPDGDGLSRVCKTCHKARGKVWQQSDAGKTSSRAACRKFSATENARQWRREYAVSPKGKQIIAANSGQKIRSGQSAAHSAVKRAIESGKIEKKSLCGKCGNTGRTDLHHTHGYSKENRLKVIELCRSCHRLDHAEAHHHG